MVVRVWAAKAGEVTLSHEALCYLFHHGGTELGSGAGPHWTHMTSVEIPMCSGMRGE